MATTYQETESGTLPWYNTFVENLLTQGQGQLTSGLTQPPPQMTLAGFSPLQQQAFDLTQQQAGSWNPLLQQSQQYTQNSVQGAQFDPNQIQSFMNPYTTGVVNEIGRLGQEQFQQNVVPTLTGAFGGLGQFGSARQAAMLADAAGRSQREILGQQSQALNTGFNNAMSNYYNWAGLGVGANQQAGSQLGNLAQAQQNLALGDIGALTAGGATQQQFAQKQADLPIANWQAQQQFPWEQMNQWANLFKVPTPQQSTQWQTSFKKGGLARFADGGSFWQIDDEVQGQRDQRRLELLMQELQSNPDDLNLVNEITSMGVPLEDIILDAPTRPSRDPLSSIMEPRRLNPLMELTQSSYQRRGDLADLIRSAKELQPLEEKPTAVQIGEAMLRSGAQGPANFGQLIGRAGAAYFDEDNRREMENRDRTLARIKLEDAVLPEVGKTGLLSGRTGEYKQARGVDGSIWMVNSLDPSQRELISAGSYAKEINTMAERAARESVKDAVFPDSATKAAELARRTEEFRKQYATQFASGGSRELIGSTPSAHPRDPGVGSDPSTIILHPQEEAEAKEVGKGMGSLYTTLQEGAIKSTDQIHQIDRLESLLKGIDTGKLTPLGKELAAWARSVGWEVDENLPNAEASKALMGQMALQLRNPAGGAGMPGAMSDKDREFLISMIPGLSMSPGGVTILLDTYRKLHQRSKDVARLAREYRRTNPRKVLDDGFQDYLEEWSAANPLFEQAQAQASTPSKMDAPKPGSVVDGYRFKGGNPNDASNWEEVK